MKSLRDLTRPNIWRLEPYSCARTEYSGPAASVFLDANENPYNAPFNRYPDPLQRELKLKIAKLKGVQPGQTFLGNGSDEAIDLVYRCFAEPGRDNVVAMEPTYGMYRVCADVNDIEYRPVPLDEETFRLNADRMLEACDANTKIVWICSPNNPTGNSMDRSEVEKILNSFDGIVVIDEAYSDFSRLSPMRLQLAKWSNMIVLNTFSKAWGCAAIRLGMAFAHSGIISLFNKVKYPYNVNSLTQKHALKALDNPFNMEKQVRLLLQERAQTISAFRLLPICEHVYPTDANFFLARMKDAQAVYDYLAAKGIIVRNRSSVTLCANCLRITIGTRSENSQLLAALRQYK